MTQQDARTSFPCDLLRFLGRQRAHKSQRPLNPGLEFRILPNAWTLDVDHRLHWFAGKVHRSGVWLLQREFLKTVLAINAGMFVGELIGAYLADSSALLADSLDMFADATVYGVALFGVYRARNIQLKAARLTGILQVLLALGAFGEVGRRFVFGSEPEASLMVIVTIAALTANVTSMWLLARHRSGGAHMKASWICTQTDVIANLGVIAITIGRERIWHKDAPECRQAQDLQAGRIIQIPEVGGLHHRYERVAA